MNVLTLRQAAIFFVVCLLGVMITLAILSTKGDSPINDEIAHIPAGYSYLTQQDYRLNPEHPPLIKDLAAFPLLFLNLNFPEEHPSWKDAVNGQWAFGSIFLYHSGNDPDQILFWARMPMLLILVALGLFIFYWARRLGGTGVGLFVLILFAFSPNFLAHGRLVTTDVAATLGMLVATYYFLQFLLNPFSLRRVMFTGISLGIALLLKFSTVILIPFFVLLALVYFLIQSQQRRRDLVVRYVLSSFAIGLIVMILIGTVYQFHVMNYPAERQLRDSQDILAAYYNVDPQDISFEIAENPFMRPYGHYLLGLLRTIARAQMRSIEYFLGETGPTGWWYYFPILYLLKVPIAFHVMGSIALIAVFFHAKKRHLDLTKEKFRRWMRRYFVELAMICFILLYSAIAISSPMNLGLRHLLPIFPFLYILVALGIKKWIRGISFPSLHIKFMLLAFLLGWYVFSSLYVFPHYLSYYNELAGGTSNGYKISGHPNYDWGQDLKRLGTWVDSQGIQSIYVDFFGRAEPEYYFKDKYIPWRGSSWWELYQIGTDSPEDFPRGNYLAVSATFLPAGKWTNNPSMERDYAWLDDYEPIVRVGSSIFVYYIE